MQMLEVALTAMKACTSDPEWLLASGNQLAKIEFGATGARYPSPVDE